MHYAIDILIKLCYSIDRNTNQQTEVEIMKEYGVVFKSKNGRYSEIMLTMVVEAKNKKEAVEDAVEQIIGNKYKDIFPKWKDNNDIGNIVFTRDRAKCFYISAHIFK